MGEDVRFEAAYEDFSGTVKLFWIVTVVDAKVDSAQACNQLTTAEATACGLEAQAGDELMIEIFYRDEDAPGARSQSEQFGGFLNLEAIRAGLPVPEGSPGWLARAWPARRHPWRWGFPVQLPSLADAFGVLDQWMTVVAPDARARCRGSSRESVDLLRSLGPAAAELVLFYERFGSSDEGPVPFFRGADLLAPREATDLRQTMNELESRDSFERWEPGEWWNAAWFPFIGGRLSPTQLCLSLDDTLGYEAGQILTWDEDDPSRAIEAPSLGAWLGLIVLAADAGILSWSEDRGIQCEGPDNLTRFHELHRAAIPGFPKAKAARPRVPR